MVTVSNSPSGSCCVGLFLAHLHGSAELVYSERRLDREVPRPVPDFPATVNWPIRHLRPIDPDVDQPQIRSRHLG
jgi:hypothetical protein